MPAPSNPHPEGLSRNGYGHCARPFRAVSAVSRRQRVVPFPFFPTGQYFKAVNEDKKEVVCPWCLGGGASRTARFLQLSAHKMTTAVVHASALEFGPADPIHSSMNPLPLPTSRP